MQDLRSLLDFLAPYYEAGYVDAPDGRRINIMNGIDGAEASFLYGLIASDSSVHRTVEVGLGLGFSTYLICSALQSRNGDHIVIDPLQQHLYGGAGVALMQKAGLENYKLVERGSEFHLPELAERSAGSFDLVFIDGLHTFDHVMIDLFYANRLIRVGGYIVLDDCSWPMVGRALSYFAQYPAYEVHSMVSEPSWRRGARRALVGAVAAAPPFLGGRFAGRWRFPSMVALKKVAEDNREHRWRAQF